MQDTQPSQPARGDAALRKIFAAATVVVFAPFLWALVARLFAATHYWFFPLYLGGLCWVAWPRYRNALEVAPLTQGDALRFVFPFFALLLAIHFNSPLCAGVAILMGIRGLFKSMALRAWRKDGLGAVWLSLWLCLPLPFGLDQYLIQKLQHLASAWSSRVLDWLEMPHLLTGVLIQFPRQTFEIEEACSGIESIYAALAATWLYCVFRRYRVLRTALLLTSCVFWVLVANVFRITFVAVCEIQWSIAVGSGWRHEVFGIVCFLAALFMVVCTERLVRFFIPTMLDYETTKQRKKAVAATGLQKIVPTRMLFMGMTALLVVLSGWHWTAQTVAAVSPAKPPESTVDANEESLPDDIDGWQRNGFELVERDYRDINGQKSWTWNFRRNGVDVRTSLDGPFRRWHNLAWCYASQGWHIRESRDFSITANNEKIEATEIDMENSDGDEAYVVFAALDENGRPTPPASLYRFGVGMRFPSTTNKLRSWWRRLNGRRSFQEPKVVHQVQLFVKLPIAASKGEKEQFRVLFERVLLKASSRLFAPDPEEVAHGFRAEASSPKFVADRGRAQ